MMYELLYNIIQIYVILVYNIILLYNIMYPI